MKFENMSRQEKISLIEKMKRDKRVDQNITTSTTLLVSISQDHFDKLDENDLMERVKKIFNLKIAKRLGSGSMV